MIQHPTDNERLLFDTQGYLVIKNFLPVDLVSRLTVCLQNAIQDRKLGKTHAAFGPEDPYPTGITEFNGANTRMYCILSDNPLFLDMMDYPPLIPYLNAFLSTRSHFHASDAIWEVERNKEHPQWHRDGVGAGYSNFAPNIPLLQLKVGYLLSDMTEPNQGNLTLVPGSHRSNLDIQDHQKTTFDSFPGAVQFCEQSGTAVLFHNAVWHTGGPWEQCAGKRIMLYYAYEHHWMMASPEHHSYSGTFYRNLSPERREMFHNFVVHLP